MPLSGSSGSSRIVGLRFLMVLNLLGRMKGCYRSRVKNPSQKATSASSRYGILPGKGQFLGGSAPSGGAPGGNWWVVARPRQMEAVMENAG
jgi:hypothetical protein